MYCVTRQCYWPDGEYVVEIAAGGINYCNPDALVAEYDGEFKEFVDPVKAVDAAVSILRQWRKDSHKRIRLAHGYTMGMTMPFEPSTIKETYAWAKKASESLERCDRCGKIIEEKWHNEDSQWTGFYYCSQYCAEESQSYNEPTDPLS
jgi:hypothetical protein